MESVEVANRGKRRNSGKKKGKMASKRPRLNEYKVKIDKKMKKVFEKRARDYNSDDEDEDEDEAEFTEPKRKEEEEYEVEFSDNDEEEQEEEDGFKRGEVSEDEDGGIQPGITKFADGIKAFRLAFKKIVKKSGDDDDVLGPVLSAHKKLIAEKLGEEEAEKKVKGEVKKEKNLIREKGHVKPVNYLDAHEKFLLGIATKGVVKLFNAVNKAQTAQRGLNPSRSRDEKVIKKRRKEAFFSELGRTSSQSAKTVVKVGTSGGSVDDDAPGWAPLRDNYMLTNPKLKDWDKMQDKNDEDDFGRQPQTDSSSDED
ncbi:hypothetical protein ACJIZ3_010991 [Penstemon smallii]|uniref:RRP15-like protein n=1 Tax=Penstemon smallii TaxID=265156 RepID=A0ABD3UHV7_9LAMI